MKQRQERKMAVKPLGKLIEVPIRDIWKHEQYDFSDWLAQDENLNLIGDILGLTLTDAEKEKFVGSKRCDIVCKDEISGKVVLIENQLEPTNHDHLGKIITYASSLEASVIVWIVGKAREEYRSAIEWLNEHIDSTISFFLIELHAVKIGDSLPAPRFEVIEQPNNFNVQVKQQQDKSSKDNERKGNRYEFWTQFNDVLEKRGLPFNKRKATTDHWYDFAIGSSICHLALDLVNKNGFIRVNVWIPDSKEQFKAFYDHKAEIEAKISQELHWDGLEGKKASRIFTTIDGLNFKKQDNYQKLMDKAIDLLIEFRNAFKPYLLK